MKEKYKICVLHIISILRNFLIFPYLGPMKNTYYQMRNKEILESNAHFSKHLFSLQTSDELIIGLIENINEI
jgi:hypothetical protein